jgi:UDP-4-amino-4,6-dideoxy-N-acetyl-beta-L-altrosamine transaminase
MSHRFLPYGRQHITDGDIEAVVNVLTSDYLTTGPATDKFEREFANRVGAPHAAACANGTAALHLCALALNLSADDLVIVPSITFLATANAPHLAGAEIVFCDVDARTGLMTPELVGEAMTRAAKQAGRVRAVFPVHLNGQCVDVAALRSILPEDVDIIEDACHALGGRYADGTDIGSCSASSASIFSFHPVKSMTTGEGGMVTTQSETFDKAVRLHRNHGMSREPESFRDTQAAFDEQMPNPWYYEMHVPGYNYRATDIGCALGSSQLRRLDGSIRRRDALIAHYRVALRSLTPIVQPIDTWPDAKPGWHLSVVLIDFTTAGKSRGEVMRALLARGIGTQVHYIPVHRQPYYRQRYGHLHLPGAERYYEQCLSLPLFPEMTEDDVDAVAEALRECLSS